MRNLPVVFLLSIGILGFFQGASAGTFIRESDCEALSAEPPRFADDFMVYNIHNFPPCCGWRIEPYSINGSPLAPVLDFALPTGMRGEIDAGGALTIRPDTCLPQGLWIVHDLVLITSAPGACFRALYLLANDEVYKPQGLCFPASCSSVTPAEPDTWGRVRAYYR